MRSRLADDPDSSQAAWAAGVHLLARRELSVAQVRAGLARKGYSAGAIDSAVNRLLGSGALDDARAARANAATRLRVKRQGRDRVRRELAAIGIDRETAERAVAETFGAADEPALLADALERRLRRGQSPADPAVRRRVIAALVRQGFSLDAVLGALKRFGDGPE
jgi:SOS response regulatory protein OraA/RecX